MFTRALPCVGGRSLDWSSLPHSNAVVAASFVAAAASLVAVTVAARCPSRYLESVYASFKRSVGCGPTKKPLGTTKSRMASRIEYSEKYQDDSFEYRHVILPKDLAKGLPKSRVLTEQEWRGLGVQQSRGWMHYAIHRPEPHILLFKRPLGTDPVSGKVDPELEREAKKAYQQELAGKMDPQVAPMAM